MEMTAVTRRSSTEVERMTMARRITMGKSGLMNVMVLVVNMIIQPSAMTKALVIIT